MALRLSACDQCAAMEFLEPRILLSASIVQWGTGGTYVTDQLAPHSGYTGDYDAGGAPDDQARARLFSDAVPWRVAQPGETGLSGTFYGGVAGIAYNDASPENFDDYDQSSDGDLSIRFQTSDGTSRSFDMVMYWDKADFLNGYDAAGPISLDADSYFRFAAPYSLPGATRWLVRDGTQFYVSEGTIGSGVIWLTGDALMDMRWEAFSPDGVDPTGLDFDAASASWATGTADFADVTALGLITDSDFTGSTREWVRMSSFSAGLDAPTKLADLAPSVTVAAGDADPDSGVHAGAWFAGTPGQQAFEAMDGTVYTEGVGFYFGDGYYPAIQATYDLSQLPDANRTLVFDLFAGANVGDFTDIDHEFATLRISATNLATYEARVTLGDLNAPIHLGQAIQFGSQGSFTISIEVDPYVAANYHGGIVLGNAEFLTDHPNELNGYATELVATPIAGDDSAVGLFWTDALSGEEGWEIHRSDDAGASWALLDTVGSAGGTSTTERYVDNTASPGTRYWYRVRGASDTDNDQIDDAWSAYSAIVSAVPTASVSPTAMAPVRRVFGSDADPRLDAYVDGWWDGSSFTTPDGTIYATGLGMFGSMGTTSMDSYLTYLTPTASSGAQVLTFDAFIDANVGDVTDATGHGLVVQVWGDYVRGDDGRMGSPALLWEGRLSLDSFTSMLLEGVHVDLSGTSTFAIGVVEDRYDGGSPRYGLVLGDVGFVSALPQGPASPLKTRASAVAGHADQIVVAWRDRSTNEDSFYVERSVDPTDPTGWARVGTVASEDTPGTGDLVTFVDDAPSLQAGTTYFYRVQAHQTLGVDEFVSGYGPVASASLNGSESLSALTPIAQDFTLTPNPAVGWYANQWYDGTDLETAAGQVVADGVGVLYSGQPFAGATLTYHVPDDQDIFRMDLFSDPDFTFANQPKVEIYGDYGTGEQTFVAFYSAATTAMIEDIYFSTDGFETLTFRFVFDAWGWTSAYRNLVLAEATFTDSYPPGPLPPTFLSAGAAPVERIIVKWTDNADDEDAFELQRAMVDPDSGALGAFVTIATLAPDTTQYDDTGLALGTTYFYRVRATNADGDSPWSNFASATTNARTDDFDVLTSTYLSGTGDDLAGGVGIQADGTVVWGGAVAGGGSYLGLTPVDLLGGGDGTILRLDATGTSVLSLTRLPGAVLDMELADDGTIVAAVDGLGTVVLNSDASAVLWSVADSAKRVAASGGVVASIQTTGTWDHNLFVYENDHDDLDGTVDGVQINTRHFGDTNLEDVAITASESLVYVAGFNNKFTSAEPAQVNFVRAFDYTGSMANPQWKLYDWAGSVLRPGVQAPNVADSRGYRISIGEDGKLYYLGESAGGNSTFLFDPQTPETRLSSSVFPQYDAYSAAYNTASNHITFIGRYDAATGAIEKANWAIARLSDGDGNTIRSRAIDADADGNVYVTGVSAYAIENRNGKVIEGQPTGPYSGDGFLLKLDSSFTSRPIWTSFTESGSSGWSTSLPAGYGVATRNGLTVATIGLSGETGSIITTDNAAQPDRSTGREAFLVSFGGWAGQLGAPVLSGQQIDDTAISLDWVDYASLKSGFHVERSVNGGTWTQIASTGKTEFDWVDADLSAASVGDTVSYRVQAYRTVDPASSDWSNEVSIVLAAFPPTVQATARAGGDRPDQLTELAITFSEDVSASLDAGDLSLHDDTNGVPVDLTGVAVSYNATTHTATWDLSALSLDSGWYTATVAAAGVTDASGNSLDGDGDGTGGDDFATQLMVALPADADLDGDVDSDDATQFRASWGQSGLTWADGDFDGDGDADLRDASILLANWNRQLSFPIAAAWAETDSVLAEAQTAEPVTFAVLSEPTGDQPESGPALPGTPMGPIAPAGLASPQTPGPVILVSRQLFAASEAQAGQVVPAVRTVDADAVAPFAWQGDSEAPTDVLSIAKLEIPI